MFRAAFTLPPRMPETLPAAMAVILSPHFDDAVLSCWHLLDGVDEVSVINVFAGVPPQDAAAGWWDLVTGVRDSSEVVTSRIEEDRSALALAGRDALNLEFLDHQYRHGPQPVGPLVEALSAVAPPGAELWVPAALAPPEEHPTWRAGWTPHPDHALVRRAGLELGQRGRPVALYADLPHASAGGWPRWVTGGADADGERVARAWKSCLAGVGLDHNGTAKVIQLSEEAFERKLRAARRYASQVEALEQSFGRFDDPALLGYEVVWRLPSRWSTT
jgi:hypothetical protein